MIGYRTQLEAACRAVEICSPTSYVFAGQPSPRLPADVRRALDDEARRAYLVSALQGELYAGFYCLAGDHKRSAAQRAARRRVQQAAFVAALAAANAGKGGWDANWKVVSCGEETLVIRRNGITVTTQHSEDVMQATCEGGQPAPIPIRYPKEYRVLSPDFYLAAGDLPLDTEEDEPLVRWYWNLRSAGAALLMREVTSALNAAALPFQLKTLDDPARYTRCDAAVLYARKSDHARIAALLAPTYTRVQPYLKAPVPALTKLLAPGVGLAEDPEGGESFGMHRCCLVAEGLVRAYERRGRSLDERVAAVEECFAEQGISLAAPYLNPGSRDDYAFPLEEVRGDATLWVATPMDRLWVASDLALESTDYPELAAGSPHAPDVGSDPGVRRGVLRTPIASMRGFNRRPGPDPTPLMNPAACLDVAAGIGHGLMRDAIWHGDRATWLGTFPEQPKRRGGSHPWVYGTLGPDLYAGVAGVALFLAELSVITDEPGLRRAALGGMRQSLARVDCVPPLHRLGFYTGWTGIATTATRIGQLTGEDALLALARELLHRAQSEKGAKRSDEHALDLLSGNAGAIPALLALHAALSESWLLDLAVALGDELVSRAIRSAEGVSWPDPEHLHTRNLTGFSHGAAGIAYALLELYATTGDVRYRSVAEAALQYERFWFSDAEANWPDFRSVPRSGTRNKRRLPYVAYWCHGAPGIALSRLRANAMLGDETYLAEARTALDTTRQALVRGLRSGLSDFSLCHGLAGLAEVLRYASQPGVRAARADAARAVEREPLPVADDDEDMAVRETLTAGASTYVRSGCAWPCGTDGGSTPGLMLGLAGIGCFYLRAYEATVPFPLLPDRLFGTPAPSGVRGSSPASARSI